jgi:hypothetical protein
VDRRLSANNLIDASSDLLILRGVPGYICSEKGSRLLRRLAGTGLPLSVPGQPPARRHYPERTDYFESFSARLRDELLDDELLHNLKKAQILKEQQGKYCNTKRPHSALSDPPVAPGTILPID